MKTKIKIFSIMYMFILIIGSNPSSAQAETVDLSGTIIGISVTDTNADSDTITLNITNSPTLPVGAVFQISLLDELQINGSGSGDLVTNQRVLEYGRVISVTLEYETQSYDIFTREVEAGAWTHFSHVMISWPFCQGENCVPGAIGFAMGAKQDVEIISSLVTELDTNMTKTIEIAEKVINVLHGSNVDYNSDGSGINPADGYGLTNYTYGMREHIFNTRAAISNAESDMYTQVSSILNEIDETIYDNSPSNPANDDLNSSTKLIPRIFQIASHIIDNPSTFTTNDVANLTSTIETLESILIEKYYEFRSVVFDFSFVIDDLSISLGAESSNEDEGIFQILNMLPLVLIVPIVRKRKH